MTPDRVPFTPLEERIDRWAQRRTSTLATAGGMRRARLVELVVFGLKQAWACVFGAVMLVLLVTARMLYPDDAPLARADALVLATDPDREGEAISWHVLEVLRQKKAIKDKPVSRVVFNAITKKAVLDAMANPRQIDEPLVDAYLARRALDYLVCFNL